MTFLPEFLSLCQPKGQPFLRIFLIFRDGLEWEGGRQGRSHGGGEAVRENHPPEDDGPQALKSEDLMRITVLSTQ